MGGKQHTKVVWTYMKVSVSQIKPFIYLYKVKWVEQKIL